MLDISLGLRPLEKKKKGAAVSASGSNGSTANTSKQGNMNGKSESSPGASNTTPRRPKQGNTLTDCLDR